ELERPRLGRVAPKQAGPLEVGEVRVHGRGGGESDRLADLAHGRRVAVPVDVVDEEGPDFLLAPGQLHDLLLLDVERVFDGRVDALPYDVNAPLHDRARDPTADELVAVPAAAEARAGRL